MRQLLVQARIVSDPIKNPLIGWWCEYFFFYCKLRDLPGRDDFVNMMLDPATSVAAYQQSGATNFVEYTFDGGMKWVNQCLQQVTIEWFRDQDEAWDLATVDSLPVAQCHGPGWAHSVTLDTDMATFDVDPSSLTSWDAGTGGDPLMASEIDKVLRQYQLLREHGVTEMTYEDYLRSFGVRMPEPAESHRPELVRYIREWSYPTNTVEPSTGVPSSALSWSLQERADKDRFFQEPGFLFGVSVIRPKVYWSTQKGALVGALDDAYSWLPAILRGDPQYSMKQFAEAAGPLDGLAIGGSSGYWVDLADLFMHGDQFCNYDFPAVGTDGKLFPNIVGLPASGADTMAEIRGKYPTEAMMEDLFVDDTDASGLAKIRTDGIVSLHIASSLRDETP